MAAAEPSVRRVALITGAAGGLGKALALELARTRHLVIGTGRLPVRSDYRIAGVDLRPEGLAELESELTAAGASAATATADVTNADGLRAAVVALEERLGGTDLLIANAGIGCENSALTFSAADFEAQIRVNLLGVANSVAAVLPGMLRRGRGHLVAISSLASFRGLPLMAGYCASKSGVNALMDALRVELRPRGIFVTTVCPGWIRTPMTAGLAIPERQLLEPAEAARRIVRAIRRRVPLYAFPASAAWSLRLVRWLPARLSDWLIARMMPRLAKDR
jgi:NAD(P)-dependent dehydrogenase (short-subunit alcohol dehydrogenase family)